MIGPFFVDTNVFVYDADAATGDKQRRARRWLTHLWSNRAGRVSVQVQNELYSVLTRKRSMPRQEARQVVEDLNAWQPTPLDGDTLAAAFRMEDRFGLSWWDALIVGAAERSGAAYLLSEDLQDGQVLGSVRVMNPFSEDPDRWFAGGRAHDE